VKEIVTILVITIKAVVESGRGWIWLARGQFGPISDRFQILMSRWGGVCCGGCGIRPSGTSFLQAKVLLNIQETQTASGLPKKSLEERGWIWQLDFGSFVFRDLPGAVDSADLRRIGRIALSDDRPIS
jgi:hypothetical protein